MARVLMVSKPIAPPWNDSSKNLVRDIATHLRRHTATIMTRHGGPSPLASVEHAAVYPRHTPAFAPALRDNARVLARLIAGPRHDLWHFFFAPNPRSSLAGRAARRLRATPSLQTVCSAPRAGARLGRLLFADRTVVLSRHTETLVLQAGLARERVRRIPPAVAPLPPATEQDTQRVRAALELPPDVPLVVYPGDLEFSRAAELVLRAQAALPPACGAWLVLACRAKTARAQVEERRMRELARALAIDGRVRFVGETRLIHGLLAAADVVALPAEDLYAKMDLPLVLIEAMLLGRAVVVGAGTAAAELCDGDAAVATALDVDAVAQHVARLLDGADARAQLGARARECALGRFHPQVVASAYEALYDELLR
jgi:phosphatidylinositol alpha-1,6-mannosyltransferase